MLEYDLLLILLESGRITYEEYRNKVPDHSVPKEYKTFTLFLKNKGKASKRVSKQSEWYWKGYIDEANANWKNILGSSARNHR